MKIPLKSDKIGYMYMVASGALTSLFNYLFFAGLSHGQAGYGGTMVTALSPIFTYLISVIFLGLTVSIKQGFALVAVFSGLWCYYESRLRGFRF